MFSASKVVQRKLRRAHDLSTYPFSPLSEKEKNKRKKKQAPSIFDEPITDDCRVTAARFMMFIAVRITSVTAEKGSIPLHDWVGRLDERHGSLRMVTKDIKRLTMHTRPALFCGSYQVKVKVATPASSLSVSVVDSHRPEISSPSKSH